MEKAMIIGVTFYGVPLSGYVETVRLLRASSTNFLGLKRVGEAVHHAVTTKDVDGKRPIYATPSSLYMQVRKGTVGELYDKLSSLGVSFKIETPSGALTFLA